MMSDAVAVSLHDLLKGQPRPADAPPDGAAEERYELLLDGKSHVLIVKAADLEMLRDGRKPRLVAANILLGRLQRVTRDDLASLRRHGDSGDRTLPAGVKEMVEAFMATRDSHDEPYHGALSHSAPLKEFRLHAVLPTELDAAARAKRALRIEVSATGWNYPDKDDLTEKDMDLIGCWVRDRVWLDDEGKLRVDGLLNTPLKAMGVIQSMAYARLAEKLVLDFISATCGLAAKDVSITQLDKRSGLWASCDIEVRPRPGQVSHFDVKNRQHRDGTPHVYVPKFKRVGSNGVGIAAVSTARRDGKTEQVFLGIMWPDDLEGVHAAIGGLDGRPDGVSYQFDESSIPAWAFETSLGNLDHDRLFDLANVFAHWPETALAAAIASRREKEAALYPVLDDGQRRIVDLFSSVVRKVGYTKAAIAMFAMSEFAATCARGGDPVEFIRFFRDIVTIEEFGRHRRESNTDSIFGSFWADSENQARLRKHAIDTKLPDPPALKARSAHTYEVAVEIEESQCGGLHDPSDSIADLFSLLERSGRAIRDHGIRFDRFTVRGTHILEATYAGRGWTVYAYCGGRKRNSDRCGHSPLVIGEHPSCADCGRLICKRCGSCTPNCSKTRMCW
jgi:hypothetical protein